MEKFSNLSDLFQKKKVPQVNILDLFEFDTKRKVKDEILF